MRTQVSESIRQSGKEMDKKGALRGRLASHIGLPPVLGKYSIWKYYRGRLMLRFGQNVSILQSTCWRRSTDKDGLLQSGLSANETNGDGEDARDNIYQSDCYLP